MMNGRLGNGVWAWLLVMVTTLVGAPGLAPEPDPIPRRWQLAVEPGALRVASIDVAGQGPRLFYFMTYKVMNTSDSDLLFAPMFELATDEGELLRSGREVPPEVTKTIVESLENPFIQDQISIVGTLLQGEANAKEGVVIWPVNDTHVRDVVIYAAGFSGETRAYEVKNAEGGLDRILLRKTLVLRYMPGGELRSDRGAEPVTLVEKRWVMR